MAPLSDLLVTLKGDASGFRAEMQSARQTATGTTLSIVRGFEQVEEKARASAKSVRTIGGAVTNLAGEASGAVGQFSRMGNALVSSFAGGPIIAGITAVSLGITAIVSQYNEASEKAEANRKAQVDAWSSATREIAKANEQLREQIRLNELLYGLATPQAKTLKLAETEEQAARARVERLDDLRDRWNAANAASMRGFVDVSELRREIARAAPDGLDDTLHDAQRVLREAETALAEAKAAKEQADQQGTAAAGGVAGIRGAEGVDLSKPGGSGRAAAGVRELTAAAAAEKARLAEIARQKELKKTAALEKQSARERADFDLQEASRIAALTKTRVDDLEAQMAQELEAVRRKVEDEVIAEEEGQRRISAIRERYQDATNQAIQDEAKRRQDEIQKSLIDKEKLGEDAAVAGINAAGSFVRGLKSALESGDASAVFGALLSGMGVILGAAGNPIAGAIFSNIGGMFAEGGIINGLSGDRNLILAADGEGILKQSSMQKIGAPFFHRLNDDGVVDLSLLRKYASGGMVGNAPAPAGAGVVGGGSTTYQVVAFDPRSMLDVIGSAVEPAQYRRGVSRADAKALSGMRRRVRAPRSGRLT